MKLFDRFKKKASIPNTIQSAWGDFEGYLSYLLSWKKGGRFISGHSIAELFKGYYGTIYSCIERRAKGVAAVKWKLYTTDMKSQRARKVTTKQKDYLFRLTSLEKSLSSATDMVEITSDPILDLLRKANSLHNQSHLKIGTITHLDIAGDAYWYVRKGFAPIQIIFVLPQYMKPIMDLTDNSETYGEIVKYEYKDGKIEVIYEANEIVHFTYFNPSLGTTGFAPTKAACESISLDHSMTDFLFDLISNKLRREMILTSEGNMPLSEPVRQNIQLQMEEYRTTKRDKMPVLPGNLKTIDLSGNARDLPFVTNRKLERELICNVFGIPVGMLERESSRAAQDALKTELAMYSIQPLCENMQEAMNQSFIPMFPNSEKKFIAFEDPVPANRELELKENTEYVNNGIWTVDQVRVSMNDEPIGIDYPMYHGVPIGEVGAEQEGKAFAKAVKEELEKK
jgi:HK97 family phage portal protein